MILTAEIGINHNGDTEVAKELIDMACQFKFNYVKFQKRDIDSCYTKEYLDSPRESPWGTTQRAQKEGLEFTVNQYEELSDYCKKKGIRWYYSPWDVKSAEEMEHFNCDFVKIAKACLTHKGLLDFYNKHDVPIIASFRTQEDFKQACAFKHLDVALLCSSLYPSPKDFTGLEDWAEWYDFVLENTPALLGYSNHSPNWIHPVIASYMGADMIEVHITLDKSMYGSDQKSSLDGADLLLMTNNLYEQPDYDTWEKWTFDEQAVLKKLRQTW